MRIYITEAQVPELAPFPPAARRALRQSAIREMFTARPLFRCLSNGLWVIGGLIGAFTFYLLPPSFYAWSDPFSRGIVHLGCIFLFASVGGFGGAQFLIHRSRFYLRRLISDRST